MTNSNYSFKKIIKNNRIVIPIIQRDYAQGRTDAITNNIRKNFVIDLKVVLMSEERKLNLNFIYGKIIKGDFIPLDGQQRLTTLFLMHWYLNLRAGKDLSDLSNHFTYLVRPSSGDFIEAITQYGNLKEIFFSGTLSENIKDAGWFFKYWLKDPTVKGMLVTADEIHEQFSGIDSSECEQCLMRLENVVSFEFLDLKEFRLTDELYIKMNARGKALTAYENFKAWLVENFSDYAQELSWKKNIDTNWTDLMWKYKDEDNMLVDEEFMRFFRNMAQLLFAKDTGKFPERSKNSTNKERGIFNKLARPAKDSKQEYDSLSNSYFRKEAKVFDKENKNLKDCFEVLEILSNDKILFQIDKTATEINIADREDNSFKRFITKSTSYAHKVEFYGLTVYLLNCKKLTELPGLKNWMRIVQNLCLNSNLDINSVPEAVITLDKLAEHSADIIKYLSCNKHTDSLSGFSKIQLEEEIEKAKLIYTRVLSIENLLIFEKHKYFRGRINFLIKMTTDNENFSLENFLNYGVICAELFSEKFDKKPFLLQRGLLTKGNYCRISWEKYSFLSLRGDNTWRNKLLGDEKKIPILKSFIHDLSPGENLRSQVEKLIDNYKGKAENYFDTACITYPNIIDYCSSRKMYKISRYTGEIKLLTASNTRGKHAEFHSFLFYTMIKEKLTDSPKIFAPFLQKCYHSVAKENEQSCFVLGDFIPNNADREDYSINVLYCNNKYKFRFKNEARDFFRTEISAYLVQEKFVIEENLYVKTFDDFFNFETLPNELLRICGGLNKVNNTLDCDFKTENK